MSEPFKVSEEIIVAECWPPEAKEGETYADYKGPLVPRFEIGFSLSGFVAKVEGDKVYVVAEPFEFCNRRAVEMRIAAGCHALIVPAAITAETKAGTSVAFHLSEVRR